MLTGRSRLTTQYWFVCSYIIGCYECASFAITHPQHLPSYPLLGEHVGYDVLRNEGISMSCIRNHVSDKMAMEKNVLCVQVIFIAYIGIAEHNVAAAQRSPRFSRHGPKGSVNRFYLSCSQIFAKQRLSQQHMTSIVHPKLARLFYVSQIRQIMIG